MSQRSLIPAALLILVFETGSVYSQKEDPFEFAKEQGIVYTQQQSKKPVLNQIHILRVDLGLNKVKPVVVLGPDPDGEGPAEVSLTDPRKLASHPAVLAFVNTNPWDSFPNSQGKKNRNWYAGQPVDIQGLAGTQGKMRSTIAPSNTSVWFNAQGRVHFGHQSKDQPQEATTGFQQILSDGKVTAGEGGARHPRTALGTDPEGKILWIVVVDGRQRGYSEGMNIHELATLMKRIGCWTATNMDGGGSSILGLLDQSGRMKILNRPSDRFLGRVKIRPLPMVLTIASKSQPAIPRKSKPEK
ncbi:MAG: phosphodiester glycosidase family protein [Planctomycetota bacterium]|nr:phosphodiester glycosidase family protein [Planctomycetota bacterium]